MPNLVDNASLSWYKHLDNKISEPSIYSKEARVVVCAVTLKMLLSSKYSLLAQEVVAQAWVEEPVSKWGGTSARRKTIEHFCGLNWQLWRHKHWNMTSLHILRLVHVNAIPMGIPWKTSHGMGQHTFIFSMRLRNRMRVSECYWIVIFRLYFWILKSINFFFLHVCLYM